MADTPDQNSLGGVQPGVGPGPTNPPDGGGMVFRASPVPQTGTSPLQPAATVSPVYDLRPAGNTGQPVSAVVPSVPDDTPPQRRVTGVETIQIAPHPTTNRFPWTPVQNPTIPIFQPEQLPVEPPSQAVVDLNLDDLKLPTPVESPPAMPPPATPPPVQVQAPVVPLPPATPPVIPVASAPQPTQAATPPPIVLAVPPVQSSPLPFQSPPRPVTRPGKQSRPIHIYSDYTREVWRVFRPGKRRVILFLSLILLLIGGLFIIWIAAGTPTSVLDIPAVRSLMNHLVP
jgi:hypothetical protein